jgi:hypothetical protein
VGLPTSICWCILGIDPLLLGHIRQPWCQAALWEILEHVLCPTYSGDYCLSVMVYQLALLFLTVNSFKLPNFKLDSDISVDSHDIEAHDSLINSSVEAFEFHVNLGSVNIGVSILLLISVIIVHRRCSALVFKLSSRIDQIANFLEMLSSEDA